MIPFLDLRAVNAQYRADLIEAFTRVLDSGWYVLGREVTAFEEEFARYCGAEHCVGVANGLDALALILQAWKELGRVREGDEVIIPANTFIASILAVSRVGLRPVLVDAEPSSFNLNPSALTAAITKRTKVIMPVHLYGRLADMGAIGSFASAHDLLVLEDSAQAHGAHLRERRAGAWGHASGFSFYPGKNLGALGDGGAITSSDAELIKVIRALRNYGSEVKYHHLYEGTNSRLDEVQAALLRVKLRHLDAETDKRRAVAARYLSGIRHADVTLPDPGLPGQHVWHLFVVRSPRRAALQAHLEAAGIHTLIHYPVPPTQQPAYGGELASVGLEHSDRLHAEVLSLPMSPTLSSQDVDAVIDAVNRFPR